MKIIYKNLKKGEVKLQAQNSEDLWYLSYLIEPDDVISGSTERKIKVGDSESKNVVRKRVFITLKAEKVELKDNLLKVLGTIMEGPDDVPRGSHHSFNLEENSIITIGKGSWLNYQLEKLEEAASRVRFSILVVVFDREEAIFFRLKERGHEILAKVKGKVAKKAVEEKIAGSFYKELNELLLEYDKKGEYNNIIIASPSFWKEYLMKELDEKLKKKATLASCSEVDENSITEIMKRPELKTVLEKEKNSKELRQVEEFLEHLSKGSACYGLKEVEENISIGAVERVFITENFIMKARQAETYIKAEELMKACERMKGKVFILSSDDAQKKIGALGGICGILRWKSGN